MRDLINLIEALNIELADPYKPLYLWGHAGNDSGLSKGFAWLVNKAEPDQDAIACVQRIDSDGRQGRHDIFVDEDGPCKWTVYPVLTDFSYNDGPYARPTYRSMEQIITREAGSMEEAQRACEQALGLPRCGDHRPK